jgi:hypothetical protein
MYLENGPWIRYTSKAFLRDYGDFNPRYCANNAVLDRQKTKIKNSTPLGGIEIRVFRLRIADFSGD